ncbi:MAG: AAA family ATPase [Promethearchaeota archaeon]
MIITKIELQNITTHKDTIIEFQQGLNLLFGQNGTGKSTILKMIGFILFDFLPGNQKNYVRSCREKQPKYGKVKIWIVGSNDDRFIIQRTLARSQPLIEVSDVFTGIVVPGVNNAIQLQEWLKEQFSLNQEVNLSDLFRTSIGVPQGTFTEPFLRTPQKRKDFFNPVLQVEVYRIIWQKILEIVKEFDSDLQQVENKKTELKTRLEPKDELIQKKKQNETKLENSKDEFDKNNLKIAELNKLYEKQKKVHENLVKCKSSLENIKSKRIELIETNKILSKDLSSAQDAEKICKETQLYFKRFEELIKEEKQTRKLNEKLNDVQKELIEINKQLIKINSSRKENEKQIEDILKKKGDLSNLKKDYEEYQDLKKLLQKQRDKLSRLDVAEEQLDKLKTKYLEVVTSIGPLEKELKQLPKIEEKTLQVKSLKEKLHEMELEINSLETEIYQHEQNLTISKDNTCPILNEKCKNIGNNSFEDIFKKKIDILNKKIITKKYELKALNEKIESSEKLQKKLDDLKLLKRDLQNLKKQKIEFGKDIKKLKEQIKLKSDENETLNKIKTQSEKVEPSLEKYTVLKDKIEVQLPLLRKKLNELKKIIHPIKEKIIPLEKEKDELNDIPEKLKKINEDLDNFRENHDKYQANKEMAKKLVTIKKTLEEKKNKLIKVEESLKKQEKEKQKLQHQFDDNEFKKIEKNLVFLRERKGELKNQIKEAKENLNEVDEKLKAFKEIEKELNLLLKEIERLKFMKNFTKKIRTYFSIAGPKITDALLASINQEATNNYRDIMDDPNVILIWDQDFLIKIKTSENEKDFYQLSGGEQMAAALAVRLAILKILSNADFAFFDEPTMNLDHERRENLAKIIQRIKGFQQLFIISHDDTFEENVENVIKFTKVENEETRVEYMTKPQEIKLV